MMSMPWVLKGPVKFRRFKRVTDKVYTHYQLEGS